MELRENILVTIGIPTFNRADGYLRHAIESAVRQIYPNIEIIVSDNCSTDHTEQVVKQFTDSRIRYVKHSENIGACANANFCLSQAKGKYFMLLHDDDLIDRDFVSSCMQVINDTDSNDIGVIRTGTRWINDNGEVLGEKPNTVGTCSTDEFFLAYCRFKTSIYLCSTLFNTKHLREIGGFDSKYCLFEDIMAVAELSARFGRRDIRDIKASTRKHPEEMTFAVKVSAWCKESKALIHTMCELGSKKVTELEIEGRNFIFRHNCNLANKIHSFPNRLAAYLVIAKTCGYIYSFKCWLRSLLWSRFTKNVRRKCNLLGSKG